MKAALSRLYLVLQPVKTWLRALSVPVDLGVRVLAQDSAGRVLLVRHSYIAGWHLPGGGVDRGEHPGDAAVRELREEAGLVRGDPPELSGIFTRRSWPTTNVIVVYRMRNVEIAFKPNLEVREVMFAAPDDMPDGLGRATRQRLSELLHGNVAGTAW